MNAEKEITLHDIREAILAKLNRARNRDRKRKRIIALLAPFMPDGTPYVRPSLLQPEDYSKFYKALKKL